MKVAEHSQFPRCIRVLICTLVFSVAGCAPSETHNSGNGASNATQQGDRGDASLSVAKIVAEPPAGEMDQEMLQECRAINVLTSVLFHRKLEEKLGALGPVLDYCGSLRSRGRAQQLHFNRETSDDIVFMTKAGQHVDGDYSRELMWQLSLRGERLCRVWLTTGPDAHVVCSVNIEGVVVNVCVDDIVGDLTLDDPQDSLGDLSIRKFLASLGEP
jgi:hypothetical protein